MARKSPYEKFKEMMEFAERQKDLKIRKLAIEAANSYYKADLKAEKNKLPTSFVVTTILLFIIVVSSVTLVAWKLGVWSCLYVFVIVFAILPFFTGVYLRMVGKIKEDTILKLYKEGFKNLLSLFKAKSNNAKGKSPK